LIEYTDIHFKTEENCFEKFCYPEAETHKKGRSDFVQKVVSYKKAMDIKEED